MQVRGEGGHTVNTRMCNSFSNLPPLISNVLVGVSICVNFGKTVGINTLPD